MRGETNIINIQNKDTTIYFNDTALSTINNFSFLKTGKYAFQINSSTTGIPTQVSSSVRCMLHTISTHAIVQENDYIMQYLYIPELDVVYYRNVQYLGTSTVWGNWVEIIKLSIGEE